MARANLPKRYSDFGRLAWLDLDTQAGQEYWAAIWALSDRLKTSDTQGDSEGRAIATHATLTGQERTGG